ASPQAVVGEAWCRRGADTESFGARIAPVNEGKRMSAGEGPNAPTPPLMGESTRRSHEELSRKNRSRRHFRARRDGGAGRRNHSLRKPRIPGPAHDVARNH